MIYAYYDKKAGDSYLKNKKGLNIFLFVILVICFFTIAWLYPYSLFSIQKSFTYHPDHIVVQEYTKDLNEFKKIHEESLRDDLVSSRTAGVLTMYEQDWFMSDKKIKIHFQDLDVILTEVRNTRNTLLELALNEGYSQEAKEYLKMNIQQLVAIEERIVGLMNSKHHSRSTLILQFKNLQQAFMESLDIYVSFYKDYLLNSSNIG
ncbi:hypothetical protein AU377_13265 [Sporosarcina sp. HYO08]|nr:hypothetical protein AU377_13265 [Sporosarcina sp. HYO08]